ncbi:NAD(P)-binding protein [Microstroma glucosiphilum]|uniref:NAD(P)-binding protein n=1 Tax=Pseudomicrostroma glucosiphilum TaxID=1684307 RepID=A0A316U718_9BASI|nr:NAD(P)-binding protein [Pseudomicrostroma glucosiphilum]PWN18735.1 NAD(P)-binding protein [Pseudomicrostroma glucosiphilum]
MPPSVYETHCKGAGGLPTTPIWGLLRRRYWQYFSDHARYRSLPPRVDLRGKTVIVSGSNSGIGKEAAFVFAQWGATVILACRDPPPYEQHPKDAIADLLARDSSISSEQFEWWEVDFGKLDSVRAFGRKWRQSGRICDVLANNAGVGGASERIVTKDGFELVNQINFMAHCLLTLYVLPSMKKSAAPRIVNTTSIFHFGGVLDFSDFNNERATSRGLHGVQLYCNAKLRLQVWTVELQRRLSRSDEFRHVIAHGVHPGFVKSNLWNSPTIRALPTILVKGLDLLMALISVTSQQGSLAILHAALRTDLGLPKEYIRTSSALSGKEEEKSSLPLPIPSGLSASIGGQFINRTHAGFTHRPECDDPLIRARLWQRVLEDLKLNTTTSGGDTSNASASLRRQRDPDGLTEGLPEHPQGVALIEKA